MSCPRSSSPFIPVAKRLVFEGVQVTPIIPYCWHDDTWIRPAAAGTFSLYENTDDELGQSGDSHDWISPAAAGAFSL